MPGRTSTAKAGGGLTSFPPARKKNMSPEIETRRRMRNALRLALRIEKRGGRFLLGLDAKSILLTGCWLPLRLRRRVQHLWPELYSLLLAAASEQAQAQGAPDSSKVAAWPASARMVQ